MPVAEKSYYYENGVFEKTEQFAERYHENGPAVYEVIRLVGGRPLFPEEHYERLLGSLEKIERKTAQKPEISSGIVASSGIAPGTCPLSAEEFSRIMCRLAEINGITDMNCRLVITNFERETPDVYLFLLPTHYPSEEQYAQGVRTDLLPAVRKDPHAKIWNQSLRTAADKKIAEEGLFEVILVDEQGRVTEGSRSNILFFRGDRVYTTPDEAVLLGVTRTRILEVCRGAGIPVEQVYVKAEEIGTYEAAAVCGTSPKVLPISAVGEVQMNVNHPLLRRVMALYDQVCERSLKR
ncbi:MAG: aminotransferase class IV [Lachnospiraceae bacterium]|nr:aminotransferase class IV [Lachnospiraceae bacterium]